MSVKRKLPVFPSVKKCCFIYKINSFTKSENRREGKGLSGGVLVPVGVGKGRGRVNVVEIVYTHV
jgi:hypothetical protein